MTSAVRFAPFPLRAGLIEASRLVVHAGVPHLISEV